MTITVAVVWIALALIAAIVVCFLIGSVRDVRVAKYTGLDPRLDRMAGRDAADRVAARRRHPSAQPAREED